MSITLLYGCAHIELTVHDLRRATSFMASVLGAGPIEQKLAADLNTTLAGVFAVEHLGCGKAVFQFCQPLTASEPLDQRTVHRRYLDDVGPCVTNLNYYVDDTEHAHELLAAVGAPTLMAGPSWFIPSLGDYGPDNTKPVDERANLYFMGSRSLLGFDLELLEPNFRYLAKQTLQYPAFVQPRPVVDDLVDDLLRLRVVVGDLEATRRHLTSLVAPASRGTPHNLPAGAWGKGFRMRVGGLEIEYVEPHPSAPLAGPLERYGPGVVSAVFGVGDLDGVVRQIDQADLLGAPAAFASTLDDTGTRTYEIGSRDIVGFDIVLEETPATAAATLAAS
ncbi:hypothetical protein [Pseudofrankia sp. BMG5.37]|uniref:hypothetical protein n=1 Tax=Pseudofrankia sp. BMG5.37 TaxID=3050035 RepID=UPI0028952657|nr:hypothetical protein [Pseudofrankia sp. BMG5.37]MDT3442267.1 hypothetical protein [Pseudofrankia sp. BMG5.37]